MNISDSAARRVFTPKVTGSWRLHQATAGLDVDWWLTFSSASSLLGTPGQGTYAAANSWVDGLVAYRRSLGLPAVGINWGPWAEVGRAQFFADLGVSLITVEQGLAAMQLAAVHRPGSHRGDTPRRPAVVPILPRHRGLVAVREAARLDEGPSGVAEARSVPSWMPPTPPNARPAWRPRSPTRSGRCCAQPSRSATICRWSRSVSTR